MSLNSIPYIAFPWPFVAFHCPDYGYWPCVGHHPVSMVLRPGGRMLTPCALRFCASSIDKVRILSARNAASIDDHRPPCFVSLKIISASSVEEKFLVPQYSTRQTPAITVRLGYNSAVWRLYDFRVMCHTLESEYIYANQRHASRAEVPVLWL